MSRRILFWVGVAALFVGSAFAQQNSRFTYNIGGGVADSLGDIGNFTNKSFQGGGGAGLKLTRLFAVDAEYMYYNLSFTDNVTHDQGLTGANGHLQSLTLNTIVTYPTKGVWGFYGIVGGGWYRRSVETNPQILVPGTVCLPAFALWGVQCTNNLVTAQQSISSRTLNAAGYNYGGGVTYKLAFHHAKFYFEVRRHYANHDDIHTSILPFTFGLRW